jgi:hypothetical protein
VIHGYHFYLTEKLHYSSKVAGSITNEDIGFSFGVELQLHLGSLAHPVSNRNESHKCKVWWAFKAGNLSAISELIVWKTWKTQHLTTLQASKAC